MIDDEKEANFDFFLNSAIETPSALGKVGTSETQTQEESIALARVGIVEIQTSRPQKESAISAKAKILEILTSRPWEESSKSFSLLSASSIVALGLLVKKRGDIRVGVLLVNIMRAVTIDMKRAGSVDNVRARAGSVDNVGAGIKVGAGVWLETSINIREA